MILVYIIAFIAFAPTVLAACITVAAAIANLLEWLWIHYNRGFNISTRI